MYTDTVFIDKLAATVITGKDAWNRPSPQPIHVNVALNTDFHEASLTDNLKYSLNYAVISRNISEYLKSKEHYNFKSLANIGESIHEILFQNSHGNFQSKVTVVSEKSEIRAQSVGFTSSRNANGKIDNVLDHYDVKGLRLLTIIGVFTFERFKRQIVDIDLNIQLNQNSSISVHSIIEDVTSYVESSNFKTVEALVMKTGQLIFQKHNQGIAQLSVKVTKPNAITYTEGVGVTSVFTSESLKNMDAIKITNDIPTNTNEFTLPVSDVESSFNVDDQHVAYIAFGSNLGNPMQNIYNALSLLEENGIKVLATSSVYISKPMYVTDQEDFHNGVIKVSFSKLTPHDLLKILKKIEYDDLKRVKEYDNGPRSIDLDILMIDDLVLSSPDLNIPHISMLDRTFVLHPLCELLSPEELHPVSAEPLHNHLKQLLQSKPNENVQESNELIQLTPIPRLSVNQTPFKFDHLGCSTKTLVMGILNVTPDSFSDGGINHGKPIEEICCNALKLLEEGADILDIGGVSTRPGSKEPTEEEELNRLIPVIKAIRNSSNAKLKSSIISVDTYRSNVARQCLIAGADIINDISMGLYDEEIFKVIAEFKCPYVMNHTRGTPQTMSNMTSYKSNTNEDIIEFVTDPAQEYNEPKVGLVLNLTRGISRELALQMKKAFAVGVRKWQIIVDPGIGFAKDLSQNLSIIKHASFFKKYSVQVNERFDDDNPNRVQNTYISFNGLPTLLGPSRKKFIGTITNTPDPSDRTIGTSASVMACIEQKTDIVRVHDVAVMKKTVQMGDAIFKSIY